MFWDAPMKLMEYKNRSAQETHGLEAISDWYFSVTSSTDHQNDTDDAWHKHHSPEPRMSVSLSFQQD